MRPILLKISGLNSFDEEQIIDFGKLTSKGLFGIFGPTGSGKTSIIDAITLALYGEVARYDGDSKNKKFININKDYCTVSFQFAISTADQEEKYIVERSYKKHNETQKVIYARFYKKLQQGDEVLADKTIKVNSCVEEIIGLSYKDFSKTVVLPQGKFSEFLLLANTERRNMLERIFRLEKYGEDLLNAIRKEQSAKNQEFNILNSKLDMYGDIDLALIKEQEDKLNSLITSYKELTIEQKSIKEESILLKNIQKFNNQLKTYEIQFREIKKEEEEIINIKEFLKKASRSSAIVSIYEEMKQTEATKLTNESEIKINKDKHHSLANKEKDIYVKLNNINALKDEKIPLLIEKEHSLNQALSLIEEKQDVERVREKLLEEYNGLTNKLNTIKKEIEECEKRSNILKADIKLKIERKSQIKDNLKFRSLVEEGMGIQKELREYEERLKLHINKRDKLNSETLENNKKLKDTNNKIKSYEIKIIRLNNYITTRHNLVNLELNSKKADIKKIEDKITQVQKSFEELERKNLVFKLVERLKEGEPCAVCGSISHNIDMEKRPAKKNIEELARKQELLKLELKEKQNNLNKDTYNLIRLETLKQNSEAEVSKLDCNVYIEETEASLNIEDNSIESALKKIIDKLNELNTNKKVLSATIEKNIEPIFEEEKEIKLLENKSLDIKKRLEEVYLKLNIEDIPHMSKKIKEYEEELTIIEDKELSFNKELEEIRIKIEALNKEHQEIKSKLDEITILGREKANAIKKNEENILKLTEGKDGEVYLEEVKRKILKINKDAEELKIEYEKVKKELNKESETKAALKKEKETLDNIILAQKERLQCLIEEYNFINIEEVLRFSISKDEFKEKEDQVNLFENNKNNIENNIQRIRKEIGNVDLSNIDDKVKEVTTKEVNVNSNILKYTEEIGALKGTVSKMKLDWVNIKVLKNEKNILNSYLDILKDLNKLFEGKKFVEFIAKKQLAYIAADASSRLKDMSYGRYALELDDTDFVIRDDYYGGTRRSPKTLSGGETFMASLCLALALSAKIQLKNKSSLEFFFLDEGFGTLDLNSLDTVMDSLIKLQSQKIKVGVISHVEEMKSRIPIKLVVTQANQGIHGTLVKLE